MNRKVLIILMLITCSSNLFGLRILKNEKPTYGYELKLDMYYTYFEIYKTYWKEIKYYDLSNELFIYYDMLKSSWLPKLILFEVSTYPMPLLGVYVKRSYKRFYDNAELTEEFNWIKSITLGFEEPYALSVFLGNIAKFKKKFAETEREGKAYMGYLLSTGKYHIKNNEQIESNWLEAEWKIKGDYGDENKNMNWSFRFGGKFYEHKDIDGTLYVSLKRDRIDYRVFDLSLFRNSSFEWKYTFKRLGLDPLSLTFIIGKSVPIGKSKKAFNLSIGFVWDIQSIYSGEIAQIVEDKGSDFQILIRPHIFF
ncbi:hypothetical protein ACFL4A_01800 [bacterium]